MITRRGLLKAFAALVPVAAATKALPAEAKKPYEAPKVRVRETTYQWKIVSMQPPADAMMAAFEED